MVDEAPAGSQSRGFQVHLEVFEGPFDLLLGLIAKHELDITAVSLSTVTDEFIAYIRHMGASWDLGQASEFLVVAATLIDLKAARLLPAAYDEAPGPAAQLMYQNASAQRVTLYITSALPDRKEAWKLEARDGLEAYYWANDKVTCTVVGDLPEADLKLLGKKVFEQLTWRRDFGNKG